MSIRKFIFYINQNFLQNIEFTYSYDEQMVFTILASKLGLEFISKKPEQYGELASILPLTQKSPLNYSSYAQIFLISPELLKQTLYAYENHLINPRHIYKIIYDNFDLTNLDAHKLEDILSIINKFIKEHEIRIFNGNYYFFNIYKCLRKLITLEFYPDDTPVIELISV